MNQQDYRSSITARISAREAFEKIGNIPLWWTSGVQGNSRTIGDEFTVRFGETFVKFGVAELIPDKKAVWLVTDCNLHWIRNKTEWTGTKLVWELSSSNGETHVTITHAGLVPGIECYNDCSTGWNFYIQESLLKLLTEGEGLPDRQRRKGQ